MQWNLQVKSDSTREGEVKGKPYLQGKGFGPAQIKEQLGQEQNALAACSACINPGI